MFQIEEELKKLPAKPGVYLMHDERDEIIYVGKAISLKNRVRQYYSNLAMWVTICSILAPLLRLL